MQKVIVRKDLLGPQKPCVNFLHLTKGRKYTTAEKFIRKFGLQNAVKTLFQDDVDSNDLKCSSLYQSYSSLEKQNPIEGKWYRENEKFIELYKIDDEFALQLDFNIYLYHLIEKKEFYTKIVPWYYADSKLYCGDCWGESDEEIIRNMQTLTFVQFLKRYKGY